MAAIGGDFSGSFHIPGLLLIGNTLYGEVGFDSIEGVTEISMPDLQFIIEGIDLEGLSKLHTFSMPKLRSIGSGGQPNNPSPELTRFTNFEGPLLNLSFPELESVSMTWFAGNIGRYASTSLSLFFCISSYDLQNVDSLFAVSICLSSELPGVCGSTRQQNLTAMRLLRNSRMSTLGMALLSAIPMRTSITRRTVLKIQTAAPLKMTHSWPILGSSLYKESSRLDDLYFD
jgi:hypothetical protein